MTDSKRAPPYFVILAGVPWEPLRVAHVTDVPGTDEWQAVFHGRAACVFTREELAERYLRVRGGYPGAFIYKIETEEILVDFQRKLCAEHGLMDLFWDPEFNPEFNEDNPVRPPE